MAKTEHLIITTNRLYWFIGAKSEFSLENKVKIYKIILKPVWTYGIYFKYKSLARYQSKILRMIVNASWFVANKQIHKDFDIPTVSSEINRFSQWYLALLSNHCNILALILLDSTEEIKRLKRAHIQNLSFRK